MATILVSTTPASGQRETNQFQFAYHSALATEFSSLQSSFLCNHMITFCSHLTHFFTYSQHFSAITCLFVARILKLLYRKIFSQKPCFSHFLHIWKIKIIVCKSSFFSYYLLMQSSISQSAPSDRRDNVRWYRV